MAYRGGCTAQRVRCGGAGLVFLASVEPVVQLVLARTPECCACGCRTAANGGIHPHDAAALRDWFADRSAVLLTGPGLGRARLRYAAPCWAKMPHGAGLCWTPMP